MKNFNAPVKRKVDIGPDSFDVFVWED